MGITPTTNLTTPVAVMPCSKRMAGCAASCLHRQRIDEYRAARQAAEEAREYETVGYQTEMAEYGPIISLKEWLVKGRAA